MDLNSLSGLSHFDTFDDDGSKESNVLTVDAGFPSETPFLSSVGNPDLSQGLTIDAGPGLNEPLTIETSKRKGGWTKGKKRKKGMKDVNAPKQPLSGYLRFLTERRDHVRVENPSLSFAEISKILGAEWSNLSPQDKQRYLEDAEKEKEKYQRELEAYQKTDAYKAFRRQFENNNKSKEDATAADYIEGRGEGPLEDNENGTFDIPIFTEEFLEHNKARDAELRQLRKQTTDLEEQNAILSKHTENMKQAVDRLELEATQCRDNNQALQSHLEALRGCLVTAFSSVSLPGSGELPSLETIDAYMAKLHSLILDSPQENEQLISLVRDIVSRLNLELKDEDAAGMDSS